MVTVFAILAVGLCVGSIHAYIAARESAWRRRTEGL